MGLARLDESLKQQLYESGPFDGAGGRRSASRWTSCSAATSPKLTEWSTASTRCGSRVRRRRTCPRRRTCSGRPAGQCCVRRPRRSLHGVAARDRDLTGKVGRREVLDDASARATAPERVRGNGAPGLDDRAVRRLEVRAERAALGGARQKCVRAGSGLPRHEACAPVVPRQLEWRRLGWWRFGILRDAWPVVVAAAAIVVFRRRRT